MAIDYKTSEASVEGAVALLEIFFPFYGLFLAPHWKINPLLWLVCVGGPLEALVG